MKRIILIAAACAALASCTKAETEIVNVTEPVGGTSFEKGQTVTLNVNTGSTTKVASELNADGQTVDFKWEKGDKILVKVGEATAEFTLKTGAGEASASFEGIMPESGDNFDVQYPVNEPEIATQNYSLTEAIPHDKMNFTATGCPFASPSFTLTDVNAALRLNLYGTNQNISKIVVKDASSNACTLNISPAVNLPTAKTDSMALFIAVPAGEYKFSAEIFDNASTPASICKFEPTNAQEFTTGNVLNMPAKEVKKSLPEGALSGVFSVGENTKVHFSKGNLRAIKKGESWTWGFYDYQYEINSLNSGSSRSAASTDMEIDLFTWGYGDSWSTTPDTYGYKTGGTFTDWGTAIDDKGTWRTLSGGEWTYLLSTRTVNGGNGEGKSYQRATVSEVFGLIIYPDDYKAQTEGNSYTSADWATMESAGCVFLPAAGNRNGSAVQNVDERGAYQSSTGYPDEYANRLTFKSDEFTPQNGGMRNGGISVRLVYAAQ